jgi:predicted nucleic acid-binding protein
MNGRLLIDTDVMIDFLRGRAEAVEFFRKLTSRPIMSVVTVAELFTGVRDGAERTNLENLVLRSAVLDLDETMAKTAGLLLRQYRKSHGTGLADAFIAAGAQAAGATLVTLNARHFPMLGDIHVPYVKA